MPYADPAALREYQRQWVAERRRAWFEVNGPCRNGTCGSWEDLEVHHLDRAQKVSHKVWSWSAERREAELAKCAPWCRKCHRAEHRELGHRFTPEEASAAAIKRNREYWGSRKAS